MCLTLFNTAVERASILEQGKEYLFSDGQIKPARTQDNFHRHPFQINMDDKSGKIESPDGTAVSEVTPKKGNKRETQSSKEESRESEPVAVP